MKRILFRWWWVLLLLLIVAAGLARLRLEADVLDLLPENISEVQGLKLYQKHFSNSRELIITVRAADAAATKSAAQAIAGDLARESNLVAAVNWQAPWIEHPEQMAELIGYLWFNQPPEVFRQLEDRLAATNLANIVNATREQLATTLSPTDFARLSYDPFGLTQLPDSVMSAAAGFGPGKDFFASADGRFRIIFVKALPSLNDYHECTQWLEKVKRIATDAAQKSGQIKLGYTGGPAFVAEISASMRHDIILSVGGTAIIIGILFWLAHRRWKPMLWLLTLLALILIGTLAIGSLILGPINVVSMGFAAILLGLAVDYAVVHYQEALSYPQLSVPEIRRAIAPSIFWAAVTTISAFLALNFGGLPGLAQLGSLVAIGVGLSAVIMIMAFLPPLFPERMKPRVQSGTDENQNEIAAPSKAPSKKIIFAATAALILFCAITLSFGLPTMDSGTRAMEPRKSQAYDSLRAIAQYLGQKQEPLWMVVSGNDERQIADRLAQLKPALDRAVSNRWLTGYTLPDVLWPRPDNQSANRSIARSLVAESDAMRAAALSNGFTSDALGLSDKILRSWQAAAASTNVYWPTNPASQWIFEKIAAHDSSNRFAAGFLYPAENAHEIGALARADGLIPREGVWLSSWSLLGRAVLNQVIKNLWKMILPMVVLVLLSLWLAFGRATEIFLSLCVLLLSGFCLLAVMRIAGWSWNVLNLMSLPLLLGTGVDYSIFMQLALRRHGGSLVAAHKSVGRALLLCGGTAIAGFGSLGFSSNAGMASLGRICAVGLAGNMLISIFFLPMWWAIFAGRKPVVMRSKRLLPSQLYRAATWKIGLVIVRILPPNAGRFLAKIGAAVYWRFGAKRREVVIRNLLPALNGNSVAAEKAARALFTEFAIKLVDLWRYEGGAPSESWKMEWIGWEAYRAAHARGRGILLVTPHLGNWEIGGATLRQRGFNLVVLTQAEPDARLTELRSASRARLGIETIVVGENAFAFIDIIQRLKAGATVALLMDRPSPSTGVTVNLFGRPFSASIAAAELARASGCAIMPCHIVRTAEGYEGRIGPEIPYDGELRGDMEARVQMTQKIMDAFESPIQQNISQWYHFVPIWPGSTSSAK